MYQSPNRQEKITSPSVMRRELSLAVQRCLPFIFSAAPIGGVFGALAVSQGLSPTESIAMSALIYSGAAQFSGLQLIVGGANLIVIALVTLLLSLRLFVYGMALVDDVRGMSKSLRLFLAFLLVDQPFFLIKARIAEGVDEQGKRLYFIFCCCIIYGSWVGGTALGLLAGSQFAQYNEALGLDFIAYSGFFALLMPALKTKATVAAAVLTAAAMMVFQQFPYNAGLLAACLTSVTLVMVFRRLRIRRLTS